MNLMAFGDNAADADLRDGWRRFCDRVKEAGDHVFKDASGSSDGERTNAFRYLTQNLSQAFDIWLENRTTSYPTVLAFCGPARKLGADNADCIYYQSWINDHDTYRISGNMGTARMFNIAVQGRWRNTLHEPFGDTPVANLFGHDIETNWNGDFELWISPEQHPGNWIESKPGIRKIFYRQYFDTWDEQPARFKIERIGGTTEPPPAIEPVELLDAFDRAGNFVVDVTKDWPDTLWERERTASTFNKMVRYGGPSNVENVEDVDALRGRVVATMNWDIPRDQALVMEFEAAPAWFWQITACSVFGASLEYRYRQVSLTSGMTPTGSDGIVRVFLAHDDPHYANWIDVQGHTKGWLYFRNMFTRTVPEFRTQLVPLAELDDVIGDTAPRITSEERLAELQRRREANLRRHGW
jgi:hypothetical protein